LLLEINAQLLQQVHLLQSQGQGGALNAQQVEVFKKQGFAAKMASEDYIQ